jgi:ribosomal protein S27E
VQNSLAEVEASLELQQVIESREIEIRCWHCGWREARTLCWLSSMRHMSCPTCSSVIVLDASETRREIARQRKQLAALHGQMTRMLDSSVKQPLPRPSRESTSRPNLDLALAHRHPGISRRLRGPRHRSE